MKNSTKELIQSLTTDPNTSTAWKNLQSIFPPEDAQWEVLNSEYCTINMLLDILIDRVELLQSRIDACDETVIDELSSIGVIFSCTLAAAMGDKAIIRNSDQFVDYCKRFTEAHGNFAAAAALLLMKSLSFGSKEKKNEIIN